MSRSPARASALAVVAALMVPLIVASAQTAEVAVCAEGLRPMEGVGLVCPRENGLLEVYTPTLESVGFIHGTDPVPAEELRAEDVGALGGTSPNCVSGAAGTYYVQVIYAQASNGADNYTASVPMIRYLVGLANKLVDDAGIATGSPASLNVKCVGGLVEVLKEILPTSTASDSFSTVVADLRAKGYTDGKVKYWVFYDRKDACGCGGTGHIYGDDTLAVTNSNNGNAASMYAVNFGYNSTRIMLHELGHNMGAVQNSAPRSTLGYHCYDGLDTMCYNDGAANGSLYSGSYCLTEIWDCGRNDYFHTSPAAGSYLATKWNLGNAMNRFISFGAPSMTSLSCTTPVETDQLVTCSFAAADDSSGVKYTVSWGDSTTTTVPASGYVTPGTTQTATKTYTTAGARTIGVTATDSAGFVSTERSTSVSVVLDAPLMTTFSCTSPVELGSATTCSMRATDMSTGVKYTVAWGDTTSTTVPSSGYATPGATQTATKTYPSNGTRTLSATPTDVYGHVGAAMSANVTVVYDLTAPTLTITDPRPSTIYYGCGVTAPSPISSPRGVWVDIACLRANATDARSGVDRVEVWIDGILRASDSIAPYQLEFPVPRTGTNVALSVRAYDEAGNVRNLGHTVDMVAV